MTQPEKVDTILNKAAEYVGTTKDDLVKKVAWRKKSPYWLTKAMLVHYLYYNTSLNKNEVARTLGYNTHVNALVHLRKIDDAISDECYGDERTKRCYKELIQYIES